MEVNECTICGNKIRFERGVCYKSASCCGELRQMHTKCAMNYYKQRYPESETTFNLKAWSTDKSI